MPLGAPLPLLLQPPLATCLHANGELIQDKDCHVVIHQWTGFLTAT